MSGKQRDRGADTDRQIAFDREQHEELARDRSSAIRAAKAAYVSDVISFDELWRTWWRLDIEFQPVLPAEDSIRHLVIKEMELEKVRHLPNRKYATSGVILPTYPTGPSRISPSPR
ncbi:hypothetical protein [Curtobacterium sp. Curtsp57]|uniref:hypothetical protein n=1 Tax=Curtobacterium sp. Curtsp57 TaxID=3243047 RepID=UPI0039B6AC28